MRPGVEIISKTPDGDLVVQDDLNLSGYRYASLTSPTHAVTEAGSLTLRAGGDLNIYGSINDGFAEPAATPDDKGWVLRAGIDYTGGTIRCLVTA